MEVISFWVCECVQEPQVALKDTPSFVCYLGAGVSPLWGSDQVTLLAPRVIRAGIDTCSSLCRHQVWLGKENSISLKLVSRGKHVLTVPVTDFGFDKMQ